MAGRAEDTQRMKCRLKSAAYLKIIRVHFTQVIISACGSSELNCHIQMGFSFPVFSVKYNSENGPFGVMLNSGVIPNCPSSHVKDTEKTLCFQRKPNFFAGSRQLIAPFTVGLSIFRDSKLAESASLFAGEQKVKKLDKNELNSVMRLFFFSINVLVRI